MEKVPPPSYEESQQNSSAPTWEDNPGLQANQPPPINNQYQQGETKYPSSQQQPGYPPQQPGYQPQQPGYPPQQPGYPPQQPNYPLQQPGYPPQQSGYPPQQPGYPPQQPGYPSQLPPPVNKGQPMSYGSHQIGTNTTIIAQQTQPLVTTVYFGQSPIQMTCFHCRTQIITATQHNPGGFAWLIFMILCIFGCWLGCCCIPFCVDSCQDVSHSCPNCKAQLGVYRRL